MVCNLAKARGLQKGIFQQFPKNILNQLNLQNAQVKRFIHQLLEQSIYKPYIDVNKTVYIDRERPL